MSDVAAYHVFVFALRVHQMCPLHAMKGCVGVEVQLHAFLTSALDGGEWSAPRPGRFTPMKNSLI